MQAIRCNDKVLVYQDLLKSVYTDLNGIYVLDPDNNVRWSAYQVPPRPSS